MLKNIFLLVFLTLILGTEINAQHRGVCGTIDTTLGERVEHNRRHNMSKVRDGEKTFVPIVFHNTGKDDGSSRLKVSQLIRQMDRLNKDYLNSNADIIFYIDSINDIDDTDMYNQQLIGGQIKSLDDMKAERDNVGSGALNCFITFSADHGGNSQGTVLGYYTPANDWLVVKKGEINGTSTTLTHEGGHFLSLPHTFYGWEFGDGMAYDPAIHGDTVFLTNCPGTNRPIELADRSNCASAADKFCDTPPDFNFGLFNGDNCIFLYEGKVWDKNYDLVEPMINNYMSYFDYEVDGDCEPFIFTPEQVEAVKADVASPERAYLRHSYVPDTTHINDTIVFTTLTDLDSNGFYHTPFYGDVLIEWEAIEGAANYVIDITGSGISESVIVQDNFYVAPDLKENKAYVCYIKPFNEGNYSGQEKFFKFRSGETLSATKTIEQLDGVSVSPNPIAQNESFILNLNANKAFNADVSVNDLSGRLIYNKKENFISEGNSDIMINSDGWAKGIYFIKISTDKGQATEKLIIQ